MLVIKANKEITDFDSLVEEIRIGLEILENRHNRGKEELQSFVDAVRRGDQCLRRLFAPAVGRDIDKEESCIETLKRGVLVMPCSFCRLDQSLQDRGLPSSGHLWSTPEVIKVLRGGEFREPAKIPTHFLKLFVPDFEILTSKGYKFQCTDPLIKGSYQLTIREESYNVMIEGDRFFLMDDVVIATQEDSIEISVEERSMESFGGI